FRQRQTHEILVEAISRISSPLRKLMLFLVAFFPEMHYKEIAKVTGQPNEDAAKQLKCNTMKELKEVLAKMGYGWEMFGETFKPE
ncbi:MAG: hypothetical protein ABIK44_06985, partial [candidate division WOR-3 bacterium]